MKTIALEEHFVTAGFLKATGAFGEGTPSGLEAMRGKLLDLGEGRIAAMDEGDVDVQVLSLAAIGIDSMSASTATPLLRDVNDELAEATVRYPNRLAGFATINLKAPEEAAKELERCVSALGFRGAMLNGTTDGEFLDATKFMPIFEAAAALKVPIYLHPAEPPRSVEDAYFSGLPGETGHLLSIAGWGWHAENGLHALRLIVAGLLDKLPELQIIVGHMGEGVPYALARSSAVLSQAAGLPLTVAEYFQRNFHVTTSGYFTKPPFQCALDVVGIERMMYSVDYPFSPNTKGRDFLRTLVWNDDELAKLTHGNAEALLKI